MFVQALVPVSALGPPKLETPFLEEARFVFSLTMVIRYIVTYWYVFTLVQQQFPVKNGICFTKMA